jgi:hypothetical protein
MLKPHMIGRNGQRGRPRRIEAPDGSLGSILRVRRIEEKGAITLQFSGTADLANLLMLRDVSFTAIGDRPALLCLDMRNVAAVEITTINTLVTISRVARMVKVGFALLPSSALRATLEDTGLIQILPLPPDRDDDSAGDAVEDSREAIIKADENEPASV